MGRQLSKDRGWSALILLLSPDRGPKGTAVLGVSADSGSPWAWVSLSSLCALTVTTPASHLMLDGQILRVSS